MADLFHDFPINAPAARVFQAISSPEGLATWWTLRSAGEVKEGGTIELWFGPEYDWRGVVRRFVLNSEFELEIVCTDKDWNGTKVGFRLEESNGTTSVSFYHKDWPKANGHFRRSNYCWAMYLRILRISLERGDSVGYEYRLDV